VTTTGVEVTTDGQVQAASRKATEEVAAARGAGAIRPPRPAADLSPERIAHLQRLETRRQSEAAARRRKTGHRLVLTEEEYAEVQRLRATETERRAKEVSRKQALARQHREDQVRVRRVVRLAKRIHRELPPEPPRVVARRRAVLGGWSDVRELAEAILLNLPKDPDAPRHQLELAAAVGGTRYVVPGAQGQSRPRGGAR